MVHFFGILDPGKLLQRRAAEAAAEINFFSGLPGVAIVAVPISRLEQDVCYLNGQAPLPEQRCDFIDDEPRN